MKGEAIAGARAKIKLLSGITVLALACTGMPADAQTGTVIRVNAGGPAYTDSAGNVWSADTGYNTGTAATRTVTITGTSDPALYQTQRWDDTPAPELQYSFNVPNGWYRVKLHFAEVSTVVGVGGRIFSIQLEGTTLFQNLDVLAEVGRGVAWINTVTVQVTDGQLNIDFLHGAANHPFVNAIEVVSTDEPTTPASLIVAHASGTQLNLSWQPSTDNAGVQRYEVERCQGATCTNFSLVATPASASYVNSGLTPTTTYRYRVRAIDSDGNASPYSRVGAATTSASGPFSTLRINAGGPAYTDTAGNVWSADTGYNTGTAATQSVTITGTSDPALYQTQRWDDSPAPELQYSFFVPIGSYQVTLHFAEVVATFGVGSRIFSSRIEGTTLFQNLDVFAEVGRGVALTKTGTVQVTDGRLNIDFLHGAANNPFVNAIEVVQTAAPDSQAPTTPVGLAALPVSSARIDLSWSPSTDNVGVTGYRVERCQGVGCTDFTDVALVSAANFIDNGLSPATTYRYRVRAIDATANFSAYSAIASATTYAGGDSQPPSVPTGLTVAAASADQIALSWTPSTDNVAVVAYRLERCQGSGCGAFVQIATPAGTTFTDTGLAAGTVYRYRVRAADAVPNLSDYSAVVVASTSGGNGDTQPPSVPSSLSALPHSATRVDLSWNASTDNVGVAGYFVERCIGASCSDFSQIAALSATTAYTDTGLTGGTSYRYRIRARDGDGNASAYSAIATVVTTEGSGIAGSTTYQYDSFGRLKQVTVNPN